jgi:hypothetical protein
MALHNKIVEEFPRQLAHEYFSQVWTQVMSNAPSFFQTNPKAIPKIGTSQVSRSRNQRINKMQTKTHIDACMIVFNNRNGI